MTDSDSHAGDVPLAAAAPGTAGDSSPSTESMALLREMAQQLAQLQQSFESKILYDQSKDRQIDVLHADLKAQREGLHFRILRPIIVDLISLYINYSNTIGTLNNDVSENTLKALRVYLDELEEILLRQGVTIFVPEPGSSVLRDQQHVIKTVDTSEANREGTIARVISPGFSYETRILRPAWVESYRFVA